MGLPPEPDEELFVEPPGAETVARRAAILSTVVGRGLIEADEAVQDGDALIASDLLAYFDELDLARDAEPEEEALIRAPYGTLPDQAVIDATWRAEGLAVLSWALGVLDELPPIDETVDLHALAERLRLPWGSAAEIGILSSPELRRSPAEIDALDTMLLTAHWRVRQFTHIDPKPMDYVAWVPGVEWAQLSLEGLDVVDRDLAIGGVPITRADGDAISTTGSILTERRIAVSWLQGYDALYSEGDTST